MRYTTLIMDHMRATALRTVAFVAPFAAAVAYSDDITASSATAGRAGTALDPQDASLTEAGPKIAFDVRTSNARHIYTINPDGSGLKRITKGSTDNSMAAWSPDQRQIAFISNRGSGEDIYVVDADGKNVRRLTNFGSSFVPVGTPTWSPDGTRIAYLQGIASHPQMLRVQALVDGVPQGAALVLSQKVTEAGRPRWSPDNTEIVVVAQGDDAQHDLYAHPSAGGEPRRITNTAAEELLPSWAQ